MIGERLNTDVVSIVDRRARCSDAITTQHVNKKGAYRANLRICLVRGLASQANEGNGEIEYEGVHHRTGREDL